MSTTQLALAVTILSLCLVVLVVAATRANRLFVLVFRNGKTIWYRGRIPPRLAEDLSEALQRANVSEARLVCRIESGQPRLEVMGPVGSGDVQVLRNLLGFWPLSRLQRAPKLRWFGTEK